MKKPLVFALAIIAQLTLTQLPVWAAALPSMVYDSVARTNSPPNLSFKASDITATNLTPGKLVIATTGGKMRSAVAGDGVILDVANLPVAASGVSDATKVVRSDDSRLAGGGGTTSVLVNGTLVTSPNFINSATAGLAATSVTNITVNPTNIANAQVSASAAISFSKLDPTGQVGNYSLWDSSQATRTWTAALSGATDPTWTYGNNSADLTTGVLKYGGNIVGTAANNLSFFASTTSAQFKSILSNGSGGTGVVPFFNLTSLAQGAIMYFNGTDWVNLPASGTSGWFLKSLGAGANPLWAAVSGTGDVVGPSSATDATIARYNGTTGKLIQGSNVSIDGNGNVSTPGTFSSGVGSTIAGTIDLGQGVATNLVPNHILISAPTSVSASGVAYVLAGTPFSGIPKYNNVAGVMTESLASPGTDFGDFSSSVSTSVDGEVILFSGTSGKTGKRAAGTGVAHLTSGVLSAANVNLGSEVTSTLPVGNGGTGIASGTSGGIPYFSGSTTIASSGALAAGAIVLGGGAGTTPATTTTGSGVVTALGNAVNTTGGLLTMPLNATVGSGKLKQVKSINLQRPDYGDGAGAVPQTNTFTASGLMHYTFSGNAETNVNWVVYEFDCPPDLDTSVELTARFAFLSGGTDTDDYVFHITYGQVAAGTTYPTGTSINTSPIVLTITPSSPANGDLQYSAATTLTGWAASLTPGRAMLVRVARLQNAQDDGARDVQLVLTYGATL